MTDNVEPMVERKIRRLLREIDRIDKVFYRPDENKDRSLYAGMLERKRDDMVRSAVLQMHTAIEDIINSLILCRVLNVARADLKSKMRSHSGRALRRMLFGGGSIGFDMKLNLALALSVLSSGTKQKLVELNTLRNKCSHNWLLKAPMRHGKKPGQKKPPLLLYRGRDLHQVDVIGDFLAEYGPIYVKLFLQYLD